MGLGASQSSFLARLHNTMLRMPSSTPTLFPALCISCGLILSRRLLAGQLF